MNDLPRWEQAMYVPSPRRTIAIGVAFHVVGVIVLALVIAGILSPWWLL